MMPKHHPRVGRYPGWWTDRGDLPKGVTLSGMSTSIDAGSSWEGIVQPDRCGGSAGSIGAHAPLFCFPFNCDRQNAITSTNAAILCRLLETRVVVLMRWANSNSISGSPVR
jgi:hypothetical protein